MFDEKTKSIISWFHTVLAQYYEFSKQTCLNRCQIINLSYDEQGRAKLTVKISGIKNNMLNYFPEELVANDKMLQEFSQTDVRAITFYALKNVNLKENNNTKISYAIVGQEFLGDTTIFLIKELHAEGIIRKTADELYSDKDMMQQFNFNDLINIIQTATQERIIEELMDS